MADIAACFRYYAGLGGTEAGRVVDTGRSDAISRIVHEPVGVCGADHAVELPAAADVVEGRTRAAGRQHVRAQAQRADAVDGDPAHARARRGRAAAGRRQPRPRRRSGGRRAAGRATRASTWSRSPAASRPAGAVAAAAAPTVKRVALELGGKNPNVVFADADFETAVDFALTAVFLHSGQVCSAGARLDRAGHAARPVRRRAGDARPTHPARRPVRRARPRPARSSRPRTGTRSRPTSPLRWPTAPRCAAAARAPTTPRWPTASTTCRRFWTTARSRWPACTTSRSGRC